MQVTNTPDKQQLFWLPEKPEDPQIEPQAGIKMAQGPAPLMNICDKQSQNWLGVQYTLKGTAP